MFNLIQAVTGLRKEFLLSTDEKLRIAGIFFKKKDYINELKSRKLFQTVETVKILTVT